MFAHDPFTTTNLTVQLAHAQRVNELHRSTIEGLPCLPVYMKKVLWGILNEQDAWPPHLTDYTESALHQSGVWTEHEEWSLLTIMRIMGPLLNLCDVGEHFFPHHGAEGTKKYWAKMMRRDIGWDSRYNVELMALVKRSEGYDVQTIAAMSFLDKDDKPRFSRVAHGIGYQRAVCENYEVI